VATGAFLSRDPAGFVDGPNLYAYVRQNPWSAFDPEGLETVAQHTANAEWAAKNGKYLDMMACTFMAFGRAMNPADSNSELRKASAQMPALVDNARKEINNSSIPAPLKFVAKAAMATAGNADPLQLLEGGVQVKNTVQTHGWGTAGIMLDGMKKAASEDPAYFVAQLTSGFLMGGGGKMLSKPGSGVLADSAKTIVNTAEEGFVNTVKEGIEMGLNSDGHAVTTLNRAGGATITGAFDGSSGVLHIQDVWVPSAQRGSGIGTQLYKDLIGQYENVQSVTGIAGGDNAAALLKGGISATPRAKILSKLGFTEHSFDAASDTMTSSIPK
jgi:hypothetical protein